MDILKLVAAQVGNQWVDIYQSLANATEREVAAFSNGYSSDHERAYAALQHWTIRDSGANLAKLINALHRLRRIDVVEKIRCVMEDNPQVRFCPRSKRSKPVCSGCQKKKPQNKPICVTFARIRFFPLRALSTSGAHVLVHTVLCMSVLLKSNLGGKISLIFPSEAGPGGSAAFPTLKYHFTFRR